MPTPKSDAVMTHTYITISSSSDEEDEDEEMEAAVETSETEECSDMSVSVKAVENLLKYQFTDKKLLEEALTHSSCTKSPINYQRLEFMGDLALGIIISNYMFFAYPGVDEGHLTLLKDYNVSTEKLARVAVKHGFYQFITRRNSSVLDKQVHDFTLMVQQEEELELYGGEMKAPKILADIVESIAGAVYIDCELNLEKLWLTFRGLLEPIVTLDVLQKQPQPISLLVHLCRKEGKELNIKHNREGQESIASVYIDGEFIVSSSSNQKDNAKLQAAKAALKKLPYKKSEMNFEIDENNEIQVAKGKLYELCNKKKWNKPIYRMEKEMGPDHEKRYIYSVEIEGIEGVPKVTGDEKSRVRDAENSAASIMLCGLQRYNYI